MSRVWTPETFAARCREIVRDERGHTAHRSLDLLTNDVLRDQGFGEGIDIFEAAVRQWHAAGDPYPYPLQCPNCEAGKSS